MNINSMSFNKCNTENILINNKEKGKISEKSGIYEIREFMKYRHYNAI